MNYAELVESTTLFFGVAADLLAIYLTVTSGYLIVAFLVGERLTRPQVGLISLLYILVSSFTSYTFYAMSMRAMYYNSKQIPIDPDVPIYGSTAFVTSFSVFLALGIIASLKFMWDVRRHKVK